MILNDKGVDVDLKFYVRALYDWVQQPEIVTAITDAGRATRIDLFDLFVVLQATKGGIGEGANLEWWEKYEGKIMETMYAFVIDRNARRLIAKRMSKFGLPQTEIMKQLEELKNALAGERES